MSFQNPRDTSLVAKIAIFAVVVLLTVTSCATYKKKGDTNVKESPRVTKNSSVAEPEKKIELAGLKSENEPAYKPDGPKIVIKKDSPADTVKVFYERLRENRFRDALVLTNLRPAVEGLSDKEVKELGVDFKDIAGQVPASMPINGEIITGNDATVTVKMPDKDGKVIDNPIRLRKRGDVWEMLVVDEVGEKRVRKEGKNYFFALRMDVHHAEAKSMLDRIAKAQSVHSLQNKGKFSDLNGLVKKGYVPRDSLTAESTGYNYKISVSFDGYTYTAYATPAEYGKSGKMSYALKIRRGKEPYLVEKDLKGKSLEG